jgi:hypothetical protein
MPWCDIFIFCDCSDLHPMGILLELKDGPADTKNIADAYQGKETPPDLMRVVDILSGVRKRISYSSPT